jgi:MFS family permease
VASSFAEEVAALRGTKPATLKDLLTHPSFSRLAAAMTVSAIGDWVGFVAVASLVARLGGPGAAGYAVAGVMIARMLPSILLGPVAGVIVDRLDRKKLMIVADIARGAMYASMPFLFGQLWAIYVRSFCIETLALVDAGARLFAAEHGAATAAGQCKHRGGRDDVRHPAARRHPVHAPCRARARTE